MNRIFLFIVGIILIAGFVLFFSKGEDKVPFFNNKNKTYEVNKDNEEAGSLTEINENNI